MNLRETLRNISYGMYIVCSRSGSGPGARYNGQIVNTVIQVSAEPPSLAVSIHKRNLTHEYLMASRVMTVTVLNKDATLAFMGPWGFKSGRDVDKFRGVRTLMGRTGVPVVLDYGISYFEAEIVGTLDAFTHTIFLARIVEAEPIAPGEPLTYLCYHEIKKGKTPMNAATFIRTETPVATTPPQPAPVLSAAGAAPLKETIGMKKYTCKLCGYVYDPAQGDPDNGVKPGTAFEQVPDAWVCPICGADKTQFEPES